MMESKAEKNREYSRGSLVTFFRVDHLNGRIMTPTYNTSKVHSKCSLRHKAKAKETQIKGNGLVQADVRVAGYRGTVDLMSTTTCVDLDAQLLLF